MVRHCGDQRRQGQSGNLDSPYLSPRGKGPQLWAEYLGRDGRIELWKGDNMSRKDYQKFAETLATVRGWVKDGYKDGPEREAALGALVVLEGGIANIFAEDNPRFDRQRFTVAAKGR